MRVPTLAAVVSLALGIASPAATRVTFDDLVANLKSPNPRTRLEAASALGKSRRREAVTPLAALVRDPEVKVRLEAVRALRELRDLSAVPALVTSLQDGDAKIREEAVVSLVEIYAEPEKSGAIERFLDLFTDDYDRGAIAPFVEVDPSVHEGLAHMLRDEDKDVRRAAAVALGSLNGRSVLDRLTAALQDPEPAVRGAAATAIGKVGTAQHGKALIPLLADEANSVRNRAIQGIGSLRVKEAAPVLREMFDIHRRKEVGVKVLAALARLGDPAQADLFRELVQDADPEKRRLAVEGLGRVADPGLLVAFKKDYQRERNDDMRLAYSFAITMLGDRAFLDTVVLGLPSRSHGSRCRQYLLEMGSSVLPDLYPYLNDPDPGVRAALADHLALLDDVDAIPRLQPLLNDPSPNVVDRANRAIERLRKSATPRAPG